MIYSAKNSWPSEPEPGGVLLPRFHTPPLSDDFPSAGPRLRVLVGKVWTDPQTGRPIMPEAWQSWLLDRVLEKYPPGHPRAGELRFRQAVIVIPRQAGKSLLAAFLTLYALFQSARQPMVIGVAGRSATQAQIVFNRVRQAILANPSLRAQFKRVTASRGLELVNGGSYAVLPSLGAALQGYDLTAAVLDELHLARSETWEALMFGQRAQPKSLIVAITTAGTENAELLNTLTAKGRELSMSPDPDSRFGYWEWSAPTELPFDSPQAVLAAHPRVYSGAIPLDTVMDEIRTAHPDAVRQFTLNQTVKSVNTWLDAVVWQQANRRAGIPAGLKPSVVSVEITPGSSYASLSLAAVDDQGRIHTEHVASVSNPATSRLVDLVEELVTAMPDLVVAVDSLRGKDLAQRLAAAGRTVRVVTLNDVAEATAWSYNALKAGTLIHCGSQLLSRQVVKAQAKPLPKGGFRVVPTKNNDIDALQATLISAWLANRIADEGDQVQIF